jgi:hypothetical protein
MALHVRSDSSEPITANRTINWSEAIEMSFEKSGKVTPSKN